MKLSSCFDSSFIMDRESSSRLCSVEDMLGFSDISDFCSGMGGSSPLLLAIMNYAKLFKVSIIFEHISDSSFGYENLRLPIDDLWIFRKAERSYLSKNCLRSEGSRKWHIMATSIVLRSYYKPIVDNNFITVGSFRFILLIGIEKAIFFGSR
jgi:hypothetical protein